MNCTNALTIVTISKNAINTISRTIRSIASQTNKNFKYICIDGGSTDGTKELLLESADLIDIFVSESDTGISNAWNKALKLVDTPYIFFLNADDYIDDSFVEKFYELVESGNYFDIAVCTAVVVI